MPIPIDTVSEKGPAGQLPYQNVAAGSQAGCLGPMSQILTPYRTQKQITSVQRPEGPSTYQTYSRGRSRGLSGGWATSWPSGAVLLVAATNEAIRVVKARCWWKFLSNCPTGCQSFVHDLVSNASHSTANQPCWLPWMSKSFFFSSD